MATKPWVTLSAIEMSWNVKMKFLFCVSMSWPKCYQLLQQFTLFSFLFSQNMRLLFLLRCSFPATFTSLSLSKVARDCDWHNYSSSKNVICLEKVL
jgi:hypothetical protein